MENHTRENWQKNRRSLLFTTHWATVTSIKQSTEILTITKKGRRANLLAHKSKTEHHSSPQKANITQKNYLHSVYLHRWLYIVVTLPGFSPRTSYAHEAALSSDLPHSSSEYRMQTKHLREEPHGKFPSLDSLLVRLLTAGAIWHRNIHAHCHMTSRFISLWKSLQRIIK